jgi:hypothetical protein
MSLELVLAMESGNADKIKSAFESAINSKVSDYLEELKQDVAYEMLEDFDLDEDEEVDEARVKRMNRIRGGVVQRRKVVSNVAGYRAKGDGSQNIVRMSATERRNRKIAQKKAARKRKAKASRSTIKRKLTQRKRTARGFNR